MERIGIDMLHFLRQHIQPLGSPSGRAVTEGD